LSHQNKNLFGKSLETVAIERLKLFEPPEGYYVAYSGGKDSDVVLHLVQKSGVKYDAHHHLTTCDPPELVKHVKKQADVEIERPKETMWQIIRRKGLPPRRKARFCCELLKEHGGEGRIVVTGVRWSESTQRSKRKMIEKCFKSSLNRRFLNVIIDWSTTDVWQYIRQQEIETCSLYSEGFSRIGCVLCPMIRDTELQIERWPRIARAWERAIKATWNPGKKSQFNSPEEYWKWWLDRDRPSRGKNDEWLFR